MLISQRTSRLLCAGALVLAAPALASCGTVKGTDAVYTPAQGVNGRDARVDVLNALVVSTHPNSGTFVATLVNNEVDAPGATESRADRLVGLTLDGKPVTLAAPVAVAAGGKTVLATGLTGAKPGIKVTGTFAAGEWVTVVLTFANSKPVELEIPVHANTEDSVFAGQDGEPNAPEPAEHEAEGSHETEGESH